MSDGTEAKKDSEASITLIYEVEEFIFAVGPTAQNFTL